MTTKAAFFIMHLGYDMILGWDLLEELGAVVDIPRRRVTFSTEVPTLQPKATAEDEAIGVAMVCDEPEYTMPDPTEPASTCTAGIDVSTMPQSNKAEPTPDSTSESLQTGTDTMPTQPEDYDVPAEILPTNQKEFLAKQDERIRPLLQAHTTAFAWTMEDLKDAAKDVPPIKLQLKEQAQHVYVPQYRQAQVERQFAADEVQKMVNSGIVEPSMSPWNSPIHCVPKPDGSLRLTVDYRQLNARCVPNNGPVPKIDDILDQIAEAKPTIFSVADIKSAYWQMPLHPDSREMTAFSTSRGHFQWKRLPMGVQAAPAAFNETMTIILSGLHGVTNDFDDIVIFSRSIEEHKQHLQALFKRLIQHNLRINPSKCTFLQEKINLLGFQLSAAGLDTQQSKVDAILQRKPPTNLKELQVFLGLTNYYRRFIRNFSSIAAPLNALQRKDTPYRWTNECQQAFDELKRRLAEHPVLILPDFDKPFILHTDASGLGLGAILSQIATSDNMEHPIAYASRSVTAAERNYSITELECLGVIWATHLFRPYLLGHHTTVVTDHQALTWLLKLKQPTGRLARWALYLQAYDIEIVYRKGKHHANVDGLSRPPLNMDMHQDSSTSTNVTTTMATIMTRSKTKQQIPASPEPAPSHKEPDDDDDAPDDAPQSTVIPKKSIALLLKQDPFEDAALLYRLQYGRFRVGESQKTCKRIQHLLMTTHMQWSDETRTALTMQSGRDEDKWTIPAKDQRLDIAKRAHRIGHNATTATTQRLQQDRYYWPGMAEDAAAAVHTCAACLRTRLVPKISPPARARIPSSRIMHTIAMDCVFGLPKTARNYIGVLVIEELTSKFPFVYPITSKSAKEIATHLLNYIALCGPPHAILSDNGSEFCNDVVDEMCAMTAIDRIVTAPYHPQSNGSVERKNQSIMQSLRAHATHDPDNWDRYLDVVLLAYRSKIHATTGYTPYQLLFGRDFPSFHTPQEPDIIANDIIPDPSQLTDARLQELKDLIEKDRPAATKNVLRKQGRQKKQQDLQHNVDEELLEPNTIVWVRVGSLVNSKMAPRYTGPFTVKRTTTNGNYILINAAGKEMKRAFTRDRLKVQPTQPQPNEDTDDDDLLDVEDILDVRTRRGVVEYLVHWGGYPESQATWEPETQFVDLTKIEEFWAERATRDPNPNRHDQPLQAGDV